ncbi:porin [Hyphomicrobium methylovorum]|uniref:porin n=1 Tax=Hyphomicrobium methylovorum TaxID=84 RepID=UPI0015E6EB7D|nr:porin [Hyphomicrobium methylovorum]MBA2127792.1 porin [Hyphomicrobium methylovorum]
MTSVFKVARVQWACLAAFGLAAGVSPASAADLGGNCCADLEERIAELEATTARKGNRKVSLTVSGWVNEAVFLWDDGTERNAYIGTNSLEQTRFKFAGDAKINGDLSAGYTLEIGLQGNASNKWDQNSASSSSSNTLSVRKSNWWLKSKSFGKVTVGLEGTATYHLLDDAATGNTRNYSDAEAAAVAQGAFFLRSNGAFFGNGSNLRWSDVLRGVNNGTPGQNGRRNIVRYDSPEIAGFTGTASWGEDDMWGLALTYKKSWGDFDVIGKVGYEHNSDENSSSCSKISGQDCEWWGAAGSVMHVPTGLFVYGGYGENSDDAEAAFNPTAQSKDKMWFIQAGIQQKWTPLGKTTVFGDYRNDNAGSNLDKSFTVDGASGYVHNSDLKFIGAGVIQTIDAAAMDLYVIYRHAEGDVTNSANATVELDDFDMVMTGARIQF